MKLNGQNIKMIQIIAHPRLHLTLISMNEKGYRINGGFGFAIAEPPLKVNAIESDVFAFKDNRTKKLDNAHQQRLSDVIENIVKHLSLDKNVSIEIEGDMLTNTGFGSGTSIRLACIETLLKINKVDCNESDLIKYSGRGGTSGIGVRSYFNGGFVFDAGHKNTRDIEPSNKIEAVATPSLLIENSLMPNWEIGICISKKIRSLSLTEEADFFKKTVPISESEVYKTLYHVTNGLYAGIKENDFDTFCIALNAIQKCAWKAAERNEYGQQLQSLEQSLFENGAKAVGMSSLGPCLFFLSDDNDKVVQQMKNIFNDDSLFIMNTRTVNSGRTLKVW
jgi:beta-ribofuranosylaminobenzene 5'-phosphate synthase